MEPVLWIGPAVAVVVFVFGYSMVELVKTSLRYDAAWTLENFRVTWSDPAFRTALTHNGRLLLAVPVLVALALLISVLLFEGLRGWRFHRWAVFLPFVLPIPVIGVIFGQLLQFNGLVNQLLRAFGLGGLAQDWLGQPRWALWTMTGVIVWKELGFGVVLFLARLFSVPADIFEAGRIDGARFFRMHRFITLPQLTKRDRLLRRDRGDHDGLLGLQLRLRDDERPGRARRRHPGHRALHLPDRVPVPVARDRRRRRRVAVRRDAGADRDVLPDPATCGRAMRRVLGTALEARAAARS